MIKLCKDCKHYKKDWGARIIGLEDKLEELTDFSVFFTS